MIRFFKIETSITLYNINNGKIDINALSGHVNGAKL